MSALGPKPYESVLIATNPEFSRKGTFSARKIFLVANSLSGLQSAMHLRAWREKQGITLEAVVDATGLTGGYLSQLERGLKWPGAHVISVLKNWTNGAVTANDIFDNLDMSLFTVKPVRVGVRGGSRSTRNGARHVKKKKPNPQQKEQARRH